MTTEFDKILSEQIPHLKKYPNYLPYISEGYTSAPIKILVVAESHYLHKKYDNRVDPNKWYDDHEAIREMLKDNLSGMNTRLVINDFNGSKHQKPISSNVPICQFLLALDQIDPCSPRRPKCLL